MNEFERDVIVAELARFTGQTMPPSFFKQRRTNLAVKGEYQYHNLVRGIFKPKNVELALSILQILDSSYPDTIVEDFESGWRLEYAQQSGGARRWDNLSLQRCIGVAPVVVIRQVARKTDRGGSKYKILGLGRVEAYNTSRGFTIVEWKGDLVKIPVAVAEEDIDFAKTQLLSLLAKPFSMFSPEKKLSSVQRPARAVAFRRAIMEYYKGTCVVCGSDWAVGGNYEVEAAHIVSKEKNGSDDPRNGLALCRFHHWAFDKGIFTLNDDCTILVSSCIKNLSSNVMQIAQYANKKIQMPAELKARPEMSAIAWHRKHVFIN